MGNRRECAFVELSYYYPPNTWNTVLFHTSNLILVTLLVQLLPVLLLLHLWIIQPCSASPGFWLVSPPWRCSFTVRPKFVVIVAFSAHYSGFVPPCPTLLALAQGSSLRSWQFLHWISSPFPSQYSPGPHLSSIASSCSSSRFVSNTGKKHLRFHFFRGILYLVKEGQQFLAACCSFVRLSLGTTKCIFQSEFVQLSCVPLKCRSTGIYRVPENTNGASLTEVGPSLQMGAEQRLNDERDVLNCAKEPGYE